MVNLAPGRRVAVLAAADLDELPERCRSCLFWEHGCPRPIDRPGQAVGDVRRKAAWWRSVEFGEAPTVAPPIVPGRVVRIEGRTAAWCELGPPRAFARGDFPLPSPSQDALLLATLHVEPEHRGRGLGKMLVQSVVKEAIRTERRAVEAYGDRRHRDDACMLPCAFLLHVGFEVHREHPRYPLLRLDTGRVARILEEVEHAVEQALDLLTPKRLPEPSPQRVEG